MGFRYRKSFTIVPGVRMTVSPRGVSYSAGVKGLRVSRGADGKVRRTISAPGTGLSHVKTYGTTSRPATARSGAPTPAAAPASPKPGLLAPRPEKDLFALLEGRNFDGLPALARTHPELRTVAATLDGFHQLGNGNTDRARELLAWVAAQPDDAAAHPLTCKYLPDTHVTIEIADGVSAQLPLSRDAAALAAAECHQAGGDLLSAIGTIERLTPTSVTALRLADLYSAASRHADVVDLTDGLTNLDDATALMLVLRGAALRDQGYHDAARESFKEALRVRSRPAAVRHRALLERAAGYLAQNRKAAARKDLERILAEDSDYPGLSAALAQLPAV